MEDVAKIKIVKAKLYNLKSTIEGMVTMVDKKLMTPEAAMDGICMLAGDAVNEFNTQVRAAG